MMRYILLVPSKAKQKICSERYEKRQGQGVTTIKQVWVGDVNKYTCHLYATYVSTW